MILNIQIIITNRESISRYIQIQIQIQILQSSSENAVFQIFANGYTDWEVFYTWFSFMHPSKPNNLEHQDSLDFKLNFGHNWNKLSMLKSPKSFYFQFKTIV